ncbi:hypothetical protein QE152_g17087 [Popillia japonica]|uniref:Reverse transcriptase n=1 Tax=Popillia japonica TaxID=7064 RepID=A0AAW1L519_POPJA
MRELKSVAPCDLSVDFKKCVNQELLPANNNCTREPRTVEETTPFTLAELEIVAHNMKSGTAPGVDGPEAIKLAVKTVPDWILAAMNALLKSQKFPQEWKNSKSNIPAKER